MSAGQSKIWWKEAVVYQIYPRSFQDSNADGIGDLQGIIQKLDHVESLGVDVIWICPVYQSPNDDNGYDISDYQAIHPDFGTMEDFDELLREIHSRGMRLIMDLVVNHSSDEHAWFEDSRSSIDSDKRDYYTWKPANNGGPPNNWQSFFGGSAWQYDETTKEYYLHLFTKKQPDLNWENPQVRQEVYSLMRFWLDKGVDGFRMDVISLISKRGFENSPFEKFQDTIMNVYANGPRIHEFLKEMNKEVLSQYDSMTVGEGPGIDLQNAIKYVANKELELNMIFHFDHMFIDWGAEGKFTPVPFKLSKFKEIFTLWDEKLSTVGWGSIFLGNHDFPRIVSRFGNDGQYWSDSAKLLAMLILTMRGTPYIYQGDEVGMTNVAFDSFDDYDDVEVKNTYHEWKEKGRDLEQLLNAVHEQGRDNARTPMQWSDDKNAGFTQGSPWLKLNPNYGNINVASQEHNNRSILNFYRKMVAFRKAQPTLAYGDYQIIEPDHEQLFAYWRWDGDYRFLVALNFSNEIIRFTTPENFSLKVIISNQLDHEVGDNPHIVLAPWQAVLFEATPS